MKKIALNSIAAVIIASCLLACKPGDRAATPADKPAEPAKEAGLGKAALGASKAAVESNVEILGSYVGEFGDNKITLLITKAGDGVVSGRTIVGGNDRPFDGTIALENGTYNIEAREPGDHKDDGAFSFHISATDPTELTGTWKANNPKRPEKSYTLERKTFSYRADVGNWPEASQRLLKTEDVENLPASELAFMRNEIFARHGYCFSRKELRQQFENESWYVPNTVDIKGLLTEIERKNIVLIKRYEKYAEEYGDEYGR
ncbi:MAG TPA: YARHG domain-containing protein [Pyrinomonadaceae bacterium]|nr:YARHG domain-containing protein [Pyrinomonadaceae bacterium]